MARPQRYCHYIQRLCAFGLQFQTRVGRCNDERNAGSPERDSMKKHRLYTKIRIKTGVYGAAGGIRTHGPDGLTVFETASL